MEINHDDMGRKIAEAEAELPSLEAALDRSAAAAAEDTFSGWLRRSIRDSRMTFTAIMEDAGISRVDLSQFLQGTGSLTNSQVDRLIKAIGAKMSAETTR